MSAIGRRDLLLALAALGMSAAKAGAAGPAVLDGIDAGSAARIAAAWRAARPGADLARLKTRLFPSGRSDARTLERLRLQVRDDFRHGRVFTHRGWRLSDTEGALMALAAVA